MLLTFRASAVMHTPGLEGGDFALVLTEQPGTRSRPFRDLFEEWAATGSTR